MCMNMHLNIMTWEESQSFFSIKIAKKSKPRVNMVFRAVPVFWHP